MANGTWPSGRPKGWSSRGGAPTGPAPAMNGGTTLVMGEGDPDTAFFGGSIETGIAGIESIQFRRSNNPKSVSVLLDGEPLGTSERGLVLSMPVELSTQHAKIEPIDMRDLNFSLLFWDALELPWNNIIGLTGESIEATLKSAGILRRSKVRFDGTWTAPESLIAAQSAVLRRLNEATPNRWAISRGHKAIAVPVSETEEGCGLSVELRRVLPVPEGTVPLDDILLFRLKRRAEGLALRSRIDDVCKEIVSSPQPSFAKAKEFDALDKAVADYLKVSREFGIKSVLATLVANIAVDKAFVASAAVASGITLNMPLATVAGVVGGAMGILSGASLKDFKRPNSPYEYVTRYHDELRWNT